MYRHKVKELTKVVAEKNEIIERFKLESLNNTKVLVESKRSNHHMDRVIDSIEKNKRRISESADKLINILERN